MVMQTVYLIGRYVWFFLIYSFLGALAETIFRLITEHQVYGIHDFLHLPIFPIYGIGALLVITLLQKRVHNVILLFIAGALIATVLEYSAHFLIEAIFNEKIWDYTHTPFNFDGRVSLLSSIGFGVVTVLLVRVIHPRLEKLFSRLPNRVNVIIAIIVFIVIVTDVVISIIERLGN